MCQDEQLADELRQCADDFLAELKERNNSNDRLEEHKIHSSDLVAYYFKEEGLALLSGLLGETNAHKLILQLFIIERRIQIKKHSGVVLSAPTELSKSETELATILTAPLPDSLMCAPVEPAPTAGLNAFIYQAEHEPSLSADGQVSVESKFPELIEALQHNRIVILTGSTGCGKTTKIPRMLLRHFKKIVCTQPRRMAAISVARRVAAEMNCPVGGTVGYAVRFEERRSSKTRLHFVTDGLLLREFSGELFHTARNSKPKYDLVIIDEAHERSINMDFLMGLLKTHSTSKLLVMSATLDTESFVEYFNAPLIEVKHREFPIEHFYLREEYAGTDYFSGCLETVLKIVEESQEGNILLFLTGQEEIERAHGLLVESLGEELAVLKLYSAMPAEEQARVFSEKRRRIIISTNIAETSITIENVQFVVDSGYAKQKRRGPGTAIDFMEVVRISKAQAKQRAGRAGRTGPGRVYRIYTRSEYERMDERPIPEILRSSLHSVILALKSLNVQDVVNFDYLDRPPLEAISESLRLLYYLKAIQEDGSITPLGKKLSKSPLEPELALSLVIAADVGCLDALSTIAAFLSAGSVFEESSRGRTDSCREAFRKAFRHPQGELFSFLGIYQKWRSARFSSSFLGANHLKRCAMESVLQIKLQLMRQFVSHKRRAALLDCMRMPARKAAMSIPVEEHDEHKIAYALAAGYFMNVAKKTEQGYETLFGSIQCFLRSSDPLFKKRPKYILFFELVCTRKEFMRGCIEVSAEILHAACNRRVYDKSGCQI